MNHLSACFLYFLFTFFQLFFVLFILFQHFIIFIIFLPCALFLLRLKTSLVHQHKFLNSLATSLLLLHEAKRHFLQNKGPYSVQHRWFSDYHECLMICRSFNKIWTFHFVVSIFPFKWLDLNTYISVTL